MKSTLKTTLYALTMGIAMLGAAGTAVVFASVDFAIAKGNNNGNNGNRGNSNGNNGNSSGGNSNNGNSNTRANANANSGNSGAQSGALNAANASANAQIHAASNSRIGLIQAYEAAVMATSQAKHDYEAALLEMSDFANFESDYASLSDFLSAYETAPDELGAELAYWQVFSKLSNADSDLNSSREIEDMALQLAANQETDEATIGRLWDMLGVTASN